MGQRARGILLQDAQARAGERQGLQDEGGGEAGRVQIFPAQPYRWNPHAESREVWAGEAGVCGSETAAGAAPSAEASPIAAGRRLDAAHPGTVRRDYFRDGRLLPIDWMRDI